MRQRLLLWIILLIIVQMLDRQPGGPAASRAHSANRGAGDTHATPAGGHGRRVLSLKRLADAYANESRRLAELPFAAPAENAAAAARFTASLLDAARTFVPPPEEEKAQTNNTDDADARIAGLWKAAFGAAPPPEPPPTLDLPVVLPLIERSRNRTVSRFLPPRIYYRNLSSTFTGKWTSVRLSEHFPDLGKPIQPAFFRRRGVPLNSSSNATTGDARQNESSGGQQLTQQLSPRNASAMDGESANGTAPPNSTALSPYVPNPLDVFNETAASTRRGTVLGSPQLGSGSLSLTLFGNQTITDEVDFVSAHLLLRTGDRSASGDPKREAAFVGYGVHVLEEGAVRFLLVPPGRDLPLEELLRLMPTQGTFTRARNATRRFLEGKVAQLRRRIEAEGPDAYEIFDSGSRPFAFGAPIVPPDCSFQLHLQLSPLGHPHTEEELLEYTAQMHGGTYDGRALPHLPAPSASMFLYSRDCLLALEAPMTNGMLLPVFFSRLNALVVAVSVATAAEMVGIVRQFGHTQTLGRLAKVSLWMLGVGAAWDAMLSAVALMGAMVLEPLLMPLLALAFLKLSSCAIFQGRYILLVLRARHIDVTPAGFQRVYVLWVLAMAVAWAVVSLGGWVFWTLIVASLGSMMPGQIVMNARRNNRKTLDHAYIVSTIVSKFFLPIYYLGCPGNVVVPDAGDTLPFALALGLLAGLQVAALLSQDAWGGRWFLPRGLFPPSYDYHRPPPPDLEAGEASCAICYTPLDVGPAGKEGRMITPCGHLFCTGCLTTWMEERMLCPVCRQALPGVVE